MLLLPHPHPHPHPHSALSPATAQSPQSLVFAEAQVPGVLQATPMVLTPSHPSKPALGLGYIYLITLRNGPGLDKYTWNHCINEVI